MSAQFLSVKNYERFQHYKDRRPSWIKLYNDLLDDYEFGCLPDASKWLAVGLWLLASRTENRIPYDLRWIARMVHATEPVNVHPLLNSGFVYIYGPASKSLANRSGIDSTEIDREIEEEVEKNPSVHQSARVTLTMDDEQHVSLVIRLANRGMSENPMIDPQRFRPILPQHGESRQAVAEWRAAGIDWPTIEATVYDRASKYKPSERYRQVDRMTYFSPAVVEAHERRAALDVTPPELPNEEQTAKGFGALTGGPAVREWAERVDRALREALEDGNTVKAEVEAVRANLRRLNESERDYKNMRATEQEAFLWIRILNWYGERIGDPRPSRHLSAA